MNENIKNNEMSVFTKILIGLIMLATIIILFNVMIPKNQEKVEEMNYLKTDEGFYFKQGEQVILVKECKRGNLFLYSNSKNKKLGSKTLKKFIVTSSDESVAVPTVNASNIRVTLKKEGITTITATNPANNEKASIKVIVISDRQKMKVDDKLYRHNSKIKIKKGEKVNLEAMLPDFAKDLGEVTYRLAYSKNRRKVYEKYISLNTETGEVEALKSTSKKVKIVASFNDVDIATIKISVSISN